MSARAVRLTVWDPHLIDTFDFGADLPDARDDERLHLAIEALPEEQRRVVEGLFWEGRSIRGMAREAGVTRARLTRTFDLALEALRESLQPTDRQ